MELQRIGVKIFAEQQGAIALSGFIPVFHRWIQDKALADVLIDVADYGHVHHGPGVLLIAHEGNYGIDETGGERGLVYYTKQPLEGDLPQRLRTITRKLLSAAKLLEEDAAFGGRLKFPGRQMEIFANDRLAAPNNAGTLAMLRPALDSLLTGLYAGGKYTVQREEDEKKRFAVRVTAETAPGVERLLKTF
jgi:hypothetical protein